MLKPLLKGIIKRVIIAIKKDENIEINFIEMILKIFNFI